MFFDNMLLISCVVRLIDVCQWSVGHNHTHHLQHNLSHSLHHPPNQPLPPHRPFTPPGSLNALTSHATSSSSSVLNNNNNNNNLGSVVDSSYSPNSTTSHLPSSTVKVKPGKLQSVFNSNYAFKKTYWTFPIIFGFMHSFWAWIVLGVLPQGEFTLGLLYLPTNDGTICYLCKVHDRSNFMFKITISHICVWIWNLTEITQHTARRQS